MSKAFTKEDDGAGQNAPLRLPSPLPPGAKNYVTPAGVQQLRAELDRIVEEERPLAAGAADLDAKERVHALDERILHLRRSLESAVVVGPPKAEDDHVRFGATVTVRNQPGGERTRYRIVGVDEADSDRGWISWLSPIARSLLKAQVGERVHVGLPSGERELEIVEIAYE